jgi:glycosyltransferase involved in cell wall biosynthesis
MRASKVGIFFGDIQQSPRYNKAISMKILEYMTQATPVIINKLDMLGEFVTKSQGGWIIDYDSQELYQLLQKILQDETLLNETGGKGYEYVCQNCLWESQETELYRAIFPPPL